MSKSLKKNVILNVLRSIFRLLFPLLVFPYVSRVLMPEGIGKVNFANSIVTYFSIIASLGIGTYGVREAAKVRDDKKALSKFTKEVFIINITSTFVAYILFFLSLVFIRKFDSYRFLLIITSSLLLLNAFAFEWLYSALEEYGYITVRSILFQFVSLILTFLLVRDSDDVNKYALVSIISSAGSNICNLFYTRKFVDFSIKIKLEIKKHLKPIFILFFSSIAITVFSVLDTSMIGFLRDDIEVGYYSSASKIVRMIRDLFPAISAVLIARVSFYVGNNENEKIREVSKSILNIYYAFAFPITFGLILFMKPIMLIMCGKEFLPAVITGQIMSPLIILSAVSGYISGAILVAFGRDKTYMFIEIGAAVLDVVLNFLLIPGYGASGAAAATVITEIMMFIMFHIFVRDIIKGIKIIKSVLQYFFAALIMFICLYFLNKFLNLNDIIKLITGTLSGIFIYFILLLVMRNEFLLSLLSNFRRKISCQK